eukprot:EG_transcript_44202
MAGPEQTIGTVLGPLFRLSPLIAPSWWCSTGHRNSVGEIAPSNSLCSPTRHIYMNFSGALSLAVLETFPACIVMHTCGTFSSTGFGGFQSLRPPHCQHQLRLSLPIPPSTTLS